MFLSLKNLLPGAVAKSGMSKQLEAHEIVEGAAKAFVFCFGAAMAGHIKVDYFQRNVLFITVSSALVKQEVKMRQNDLLVKIQQNLVSTKVKEIRATIGSIETLN